MTAIQLRKDNKVGNTASQLKKVFSLYLLSIFCFCLSLELFSFFRFLGMIVLSEVRTVLHKITMTQTDNVWQRFVMGWFVPLYI